MRRVRRAVLTHEQNCDAAGEPADDLIGGINRVPLLLDFAGLGHVGFHDSYAARCQAQNVVQIVRIQQFTAAWGGPQGRQKQGLNKAILLMKPITNRIFLLRPILQNQDGFILLYLGIIKPGC